MITENINQHIYDTIDSKINSLGKKKKSSILPQDVINEGQDLSYLIQKNQTLLSYASVVLDRRAFQRAGTQHGDEFNMFDTPNNVYFKLLFYFWNGDDDDPGETTLSGGLLAPTWEIENWNDNPYKYTSAWTYLKNNNEEERAKLLEQFVLLLSNISCYAPWYFTEIGNVGEALSRKHMTENAFKIDEQRKSITIKCLPDPYDNKISTLLDLYRAIVWSQEMKREVLPANLRKFDMGLYIFSDSICNIHRAPKAEIGSNGVVYKDNYASIGETQQYKTSYKYIEFHNCEIDYNSSITGYEGLNNAEGNQQEFTITIYFDDCYEDRYNEFMFKTIGDFVKWDISLQVETQEDYKSKYSQELQNRIHLYENNLEVLNGINDTSIPRNNFFKDKITGLLKGAGKEIIGAGKEYLKTQVKKLFFGNLFGLSISRLIDGGELLSRGKVFNVAGRINNEVNKNRVSNKIVKLGNIFKSETVVKNL